MKKCFSMGVLLFCVLLLALPAYASESETTVCAETVNTTEEYLTVVYGTKSVTCENPIIKEGDFTFLPLRETLEVYGATLSWAKEEAEKKIIISAGQDRCQLVLNLEDQVAYGVDGNEFLLRHVDDVLYLPVHFFVQMVNCESSWEKETNTLTLYPEKFKKDALTVGSNNTTAVSRWIMNLPVYEKTVSSRYSGMRLGNGEIYETGVASYYGGKFHGRRTASGERYDQNALTAAHKTLSFGTIVRVTAEWNQKTVDVRIIDRGPYSRGRVIDLSTAAAAELGMLSKGVGNVTLEVLAWPL